MKLPIYLYGQPVLREEAEDITPDYPELKSSSMICGRPCTPVKAWVLQLPQIGKPISLIVLDGSALAEDFPECNDSKMVLINPVLDVIEDMDPVSRSEGCLSLPGMSETSAVSSMCA